MAFCLMTFDVLSRIDGVSPEWHLAPEPENSSNDPACWSTPGHDPIGFATNHFALVVNDETYSPEDVERIINLYVTHKEKRKIYQRKYYKTKVGKKVQQLSNEKYQDKKRESKKLNQHLTHTVQ